MGTFSCNKSYIGETKRNREVRWKEHCSNNDKESEVAEISYIYIYIVFLQISLRILAFNDKVNLKNLSHLLKYI